MEQVRPLNSYLYLIFPFQRHFTTDRLHPFIEHEPLCVCDPEAAFPLNPAHEKSGEVEPGADSRGREEGFVKGSRV